MRTSSLGLLAVSTFASVVACSAPAPDTMLSSSSSSTSTGGASVGAGVGSGGAGGIPTSNTARAVVDVSTKSGAGPLEVTLSACQSTGGDDGALVHYAWDLGDGERASGRVVKHTYSKGAFKPRLVITTDRGTQASGDGAIDGPGPDPSPRVTDGSGHPRLYVDAGHIKDLLETVANAPILGAPGYPNSYVTGYLLDGKAWEGADYYRVNYSGCTNFTKDAKGKDVCSAGAQTGDACAYFNELGFLKPSKAGVAVDDPVQASRRVGDCLTTLAAGATLATDAAQKKRLEQALVSALLHMANAWPKTGPGAGFGRWLCGNCALHQSNLNNGELLYAAALGYDLVYGAMQPSERDAVRDLLIREARWVYQASTHDEANVPGSKYVWWSQDGANNWDAVIHGGFGLAALALKGDPTLAPGEADTWIAYAVTRMHHYLDTNFDGDGVNYEDLGHAKYGAERAAQFLVALRAVTGQDELGYRDRTLQRFQRYLVQATEPTLDGPFANDGTGRDYLSWGTSLLLASAYRDPFAAWHWDRLSGASRPAVNGHPFKAGGSGAQAQLLQAPLSYDPSIAPESPEGRLPLGVVYPDFGRALFRSAWEDDKTLFLGAEAGVFGSHGKANQGEFTVTANGAHLLDTKAPLDVSSGYNVVLVDGEDQKTSAGQAEHDLVHLAKTRDWMDAPRFDLVRFDTTGAYKAPLDRAERGFLFVRRPDASYAVVLDEVAAKAAHDVAFHAHAGAGATLTGSGGSFSILQNKGNAGLEIIQLASPSATSSTTNGTLVTTSHGDAVAFATLLFPTSAASPSVDVAPNASKAGFSMTVLGDEIAFLPGGGAATSDASTDGDLLLARQGATPAFVASRAKELRVSGASRLTSSLPATFVLEPDADRARLWVSASDGGAIDLTITLEPSSTYALSLDDLFVALVKSGEDGALALPSVTRDRPRALILERAVAHACP